MSKNTNLTHLICQVLEIDDQAREVRCKFMVRSGTLYHWPDPHDTAWQPLDDIVTVVLSPTVINSREQCTFSSDEITRVEMLLRQQHVNKINFK